MALFVSGREHELLLKSHNALRAEAAASAAENEYLRALLRQALPLAVNAAANLVGVFGPLKTEGTTENDAAIVLRAEDGLALVYVFPAGGALVIHDPAGVVAEVGVELVNGNLTSGAIEVIERFLADVLFSRREPRNASARGAIDLTARLGDVFEEVET